MITKQLINEIRKKHILPWHGVHGVAHWSRVRWNGLKLAEKTGANKRVVELFAFLHDSCRITDRADLEHGDEAARFVRYLQVKHVIKLSEYELSLLQFACRFHSHGGNDSNITVQTCWDADRLDLGRVGIIPDPNLLCTDAARELREEAYARSIGYFKKNNYLHFYNIDL